MYYELALISVLVAGGYWGWYFVRHDATRLYGVLQLGAAALSGLGLIGAKLDKPGLGVPGAVGVGAGVCLLLIAPLARATARRFAANERFGLAQRMLDIAEVLAPGSGVGDEKALLGAMREIRDGNIEQAVEALTAAKDRAPAEARLAIDERIAMLYLAAYRWEDAIEHAETHLFDAIPPAAESTPTVALRSVLGIAPPVWVELLGAYGYKGDLDQAARMLARLEDACAGRPDASVWLHRGRLIFLALAGRVDAVQALVARRRSRHMKPAARTYWVAVAHERHGEVAAAEAAYTKARSRSRGRPRVLIDQALARLANAKPVELGPAATEVIARVESAPPPRVTERLRPRSPIAPRILFGAMIVVSAILAFGVGSTSDIGTLLRGGALVRGLISDGEWWRLVSCIFVHVGVMHLAVNVIGLWLLGRLTEDLFGPWRTLAIFAIAGLAGSAASYLLGTAGVSAGASGALFGFVGAVFVELTLHRRRYRTAWNRGVWGSLVFVTVAQVGIDLLYPVTDQWAHGGGLVAGALAGFLFSTNGRFTHIAQHVARVVAIAFAALVIVAAVQVSRTSIAHSLARSDRALPDLAIMMQTKRGVAFENYAAEELANARKLELDDPKPASDNTVPLPPGWQGRELETSAADPLGNRQYFRIVVATRSDGLLATIYVPETIARAAPAFFTQLLASLP